MMNPEEVMNDDFIENTRKDHERIPPCKSIYKVSF